MRTIRHVKVSDIEKSGVFPERFRRATLSPEGLRKLAPTGNQVVLSQVKASGDEQLDSEMWTKTQEEIHKCWISEMMEPSSMSLDFPLARRFAIHQKKDKIRLIDDFSCCMTNSTTTSHEKPSLETIDNRPEKKDHRRCVCLHVVLL